MDTANTNTQEDLFRRVDEYDWDNDPEFQGGLRAILGSAASPEQVQHLTLRARCFYFSRKFGQRVDFNGYLRWLGPATQNTLNGHGGAAVANAESSDSVMNTSDDELPASDAPSAYGNAPTPASFAEICEMIAEGKPIPGIKEIPDTVLEGQGTESNANRRKKPWEKDSSESAGTPSWLST